MTVMCSSSVESFYTAPSSLDELSSIVNLNAKSYHLTIYHKKPNSDWEEITQSYIEQAKGVDLQKILQEHIKCPYKNIEITTSIDLKEGFICKAKDTDGIVRKVAGFSLTESQNSKIFAVLKKIKIPKGILTSSSLSKENLQTLHSSSVKMSLEEVKTERVNDYLKQVDFYNKPVGFKNKSNNCSFNSCLQMLINEPALLNIYTTVASHYAKSTKAEDQECGNWMLSTLDFYDQAIKEQEPISEEISNKLRLAMHYLSPKEISSKHCIQEDASEILTILFAKYDDILKKQNLINTSSINYKFENVTLYRPKRILSEIPHEDCSSLHPDYTYRKEKTSYGIKIGFDSEQKNFTLYALLEKYFCDEQISIGSEACRYLINGVYTEVLPVKEEIKFDTLPKDLYMNFARFKSDQTKLTSSIEIPEKLDAKLLNITGSSPGSYELSSFIVHLGRSLNGGHYIAYRKVRDQWIECNDERVSPCSKEQALEAAKQSYICFYRLRSHPTIKDKLKKHLQDLKDKQASHLQKLETFSQKGEWQHLQKHTRHPDSGFDWWMFPTNRRSVGYGDQYVVKQEEITNLLADEEFMRNYRKGVILVAKSWGWDLANNSDITNDKQLWTGYWVRLGKMLCSLQLFKQTDLHANLVGFLQHKKLVDQIPVKESWIKDYLN